VRKFEDAAGVARRSDFKLGVFLLSSLVVVGANALAEDMIAIKMAKLARDTFFIVNWGGDWWDAIDLSRSSRYCKDDG
jgi:hypothetical protein